MKISKYLLPFIVVVALILTSTVAVFAQDLGQNGTTLTATITAQAHLVRTFGWTIDKSVDPEALVMFKGDSGDVEYSIDVTKDAGTLSGYFDGEVCVTNGGSVTTEGLAISVKLTIPSDKDNILGSTDATGIYELAPSQTGCFPYHLDYAGLISGQTYKLTADVTITNHSGYLGTPFGPSPSATTSTSTETLVNDTVNVDDTNGGSWLFTGTGGVTYSHTFTCNADEGQNDNTATIRETDQSDSASILVTCYELDVTKDASTSFTRTYGWDISKSVDQSSLTLAVNQSYLVNYTINVWGTGYTDSLWEVHGTITISNPAPMDATLTGVADVVSDSLNASVDCPAPLVVPAGGTLECTYNLDLPDGSERTNTATATLQNTPSGTTDFSGSADVTFIGVDPAEVDECIQVDDSFAGPLGTVCYPSSHTYTYSRTIGPYAVCGVYNVGNIASFVTNDTGAIGEASANVDINVPCSGCSLTIGYWKTHAGFGPQEDMLTPLLPQYLGIQSVLTNLRAVQFLSFYGSDYVFAPSNGINKLYAQLLGAKLNIANGADGSAIASTISQADAYLLTWTSPSWFSINKNQKNMILSLANTLDQYNNGLIGPGHCDQ